MVTKLVTVNDKSAREILASCFGVGIRQDYVNLYIEIIGGRWTGGVMGNVLLMLSFEKSGVVEIVFSSSIGFLLFSDFIARIMINIVFYVFFI